jgi:hypothetical protein
MLYGRLFLERIRRWMPDLRLGYYLVNGVFVEVEDDSLHQKSMDLPCYRFAFPG